MHEMVLHLIPTLSGSIAQTFVAGLWQGILLVTAVGLCLRLLPRASASLRFAAWTLAFVAIMAVPLLHRSAVAQASPAPAGIHLSPVHLNSVWSYGIAVVWAALMLLRGVQLALDSLRLRRIWRGATVVAADVALAPLLRRSGREVELCTSADVDAPGVIGFFSPRLLVPDWLFAQLTPAELAQIVLHECEHLRRRDDWFNLLQKIALVLFPLNPALLWVDRRLALEREMACDAGVVASTAAPFDYASCLTRLAERRLEHRRAALVLAAWTRQSELARRVHRLLRPIAGMSSLQARFALLLLSCGLTAGAVEMARAPRFVTFTDTVPTTATQSRVAAVALGAHYAMRHATPAAYTAPRPAHEVLLNAVMPRGIAPSARPAALSAGRPRTEIRTGTGQVSPAQSSPIQRHPQAQRGEQQRGMVLTSSKTLRKPSHPVPALYTVRTGFYTTYAAVPFGDGWLIVQL